MPCTTILVGKKASYNGSTMVARNEDGGQGHYQPKQFIVVKPEDQPRKYISVLSQQEINLPDDPMRYTAMPNALAGEGIWAAAGVNSANVAMSATETIANNERVLAADPLLPSPRRNKGCGGIGEEDLVTITLPYIHSAREGVERLGMLHETCGTYEMNGIAFQDVNEIWWFETIGGHHWMAVRVPDDMYVVMPNQLGIDHFDFEDAYGEKKNFMCSSDLKEFTEKYHLDLNTDGKFNPRNVYGTHKDSDHSYNTPRAWIIERYFNPRTYKWEGEHADFTPESDDIPWMLKPEHKITVEDIKYALSLHYQGTEYDPYGKYGDPSKRGKYRPIGINRTNFLALTELRSDVEEEIMAVEWIAYASNVFNAFVPFYANVESTPDYMKTHERVTPDEFYWANRMIGAMADASWKTCAAHIGRYQENVVVKCRHLMNLADEEYHKTHDLTILEKTNQMIADEVKSLTDDVLARVLHERTGDMKNRYTMEDA